MRYFVIAASVVCVFILFSCGENEGGGNVETTKSASAPSLSAPANPSDNPASIQPVSNPSAPLIATGSGRVNPAHGQPGHRCDIAVGAPLPAAANAPVLNTNPVSTPVINPTAPPATVVQPQPQPAATVASGINPAHGQPGHRCDIPVGESLSKAPAPKTTTTSSPVITPNKPLVEAPDTMFAKGLNPAHGKPGHRCDIAVGQPLASAAKKDSGKTN